MPFALVIIGLLLIITGFQNTYKQMGLQLEKDFSGSGSFIYWLIAIGAVGALGYNKTLEPFSRAFMALIIIVMFLSNKGVFGQVNSEISQGSNTAPLPAGGGASIGGSGGSGGNGGFDLSSIGDVGSIASDIGSLF